MHASKRKTLDLHHELIFEIIRIWISLSGYHEKLAIIYFKLCELIMNRSQ